MAFMQFQQNRRLTLGVVGSLLVAGLVPGCEERLPPASPAPAPPAGPSVARLELVGPETVYIGKPTQYSVIGHFDDGTSRDTTREATWRVDSARLVMSTQGLMTGKSKGDTRIDVSLGGRRAEIGRVVVVPEGTFRLHGSIRDQFTGVDAAVRIDDPALGSVEVPAPFGEFVVWGVGGGETWLTAIKEGYQNQTQVMTLTEHQHVFFELQLANPRPQLVGRYTLTVDAAPECKTLPDEVRRRSYIADIQQSGPEVTVQLSGSVFASGRSAFPGFVEAGRVTFGLASAINYDWIYPPTILEILSNDVNYSFDGKAVIPLSNGALAGRLDGGLGTLTGPTYQSVSRCQSANHSFVLSR